MCITLLRLHLSYVFHRTVRICSVTPAYHGVIFREEENAAVFASLLHVFCLHMPLFRKLEGVLDNERGSYDTSCTSQTLVEWLIDPFLMLRKHMT